MLKSHSITRFAGMALGLAMASTCAIAQNNKTVASGPYLTAGLGAGYWETYDPSAAETLQANGGGTATSDKFSAAGRIGIGYRVNEYSNFELNLHHGGKYSMKLDAAAGNAEIDMEVRRVAATFLLTAPINPAWTLTGRIGVHRWEEQFSVGGTDTGKRRSSGFTFGLGARFPVTQTTDVSVEYQNFQHDKDSRYQTFGELLAGIAVRF